MTDIRRTMLWVVFSMSLVFLWDAWQKHTGHPSMFGLFFAEVPPDNYRDWKTSDYSFYDAMAHYLHDLNVIVEPYSREPWFRCEAHGLDETCLTDTLNAVETEVDLVLERGVEAAE